jgi:NTP pyrophosphatase (non-canonical NTP hydrolase)
MNPASLTIADFQKHIAGRYEKTDRERNLEEEFADCLAWLCTLANINDIDLAAAIAKKYLGENRPQGHK